MAEPILKGRVPLSVARACWVPVCTDDCELLRTSDYIPTKRINPTQLQRDTISNRGHRFGVRIKSRSVILSWMPCHKQFKRSRSLHFGVKAGMLWIMKQQRAAWDFLNACMLKAHNFSQFRWYHKISIFVFKVRVEGKYDTKHKCIRWQPSQRSVRWCHKTF